MNHKSIEIVGGSHDGAVYAVPLDAKALHVQRLREPKSLWDADIPHSLSFVTEIYGPKTEADKALNRWSLLDVTNGHINANEPVRGES